MTHKSRTDRRSDFKLGSKVGHVTRHEQQLFKDKRSKVKVTKSRDVSANKNAITRQCMVILTSNLVGISTWGSTRAVASFQPNIGGGDLGSNISYSTTSPSSLL